MEDEVIETPTAKMWMGEEGVVRTVYKLGATETILGIRAGFDALKKLTAGEVSPVLLDIRGLKSTDQESRQFASSEELEVLKSATGILIGSPVSKVIGNLFLRLNKPQRPTRLFTSEAKAIEWLKGFIE